MPDLTDDRTIERSLRASVLDGACWAVMFGAGEGYIRRWAIHWNADELTLALLGAIPLFLAGFAQVLSANLQEVYPHRKRLFLPIALVQALTWIPMAVLPVLWSEQAPLLILAVACLYFACAYFMTPPWNSLMGDLVPPERRGVYFGNRLRIVNLCTLTALLLGGWFAGRWPAAVSVGGFAVGFRPNLPFLFIVSGVIRGGVVLLFLPLFREVRPVEPIRTWKLFFRVLNVNAFQGAGFDILGEDRRMRPAAGEAESREQRRGDDKGDNTAGGIWDFGF